MSDPSELDTLQDQIFDLIERSQAAMVGAGRAFTESVSNIVPGETGAIDDLIDRAFDLTEKVLEAQREFAKNLLHTAAAQVTPSEDD